MLFRRKGKSVDALDVRIDHQTLRNDALELAVTFLNAHDLAYERLELDAIAPGISEIGKALGLERFVDPHFESIVAREQDVIAVAIIAELIGLKIPGIFFEERQVIGGLRSG